MKTNTNFIPHSANVVYKGYKISLLAVLLTSAFLLSGLVPIYTSAEGANDRTTRAITSGTSELDGRWINKSYVIGAGIFFSNATVVNEGPADLNMDYNGSRIYTMTGGGIRDMGTISLEDVAQAPTSGYTNEIDLSTGSWIGKVFCLYTKDWHYVKFEILEHTYVPSPVYPASLGHLKIKWYYQDDGSRSFTEQGNSKVVETTTNLSPTVSCKVKTSAGMLPNIEVLPLSEVYSTDLGAQIKNTDTKVLGMVNVTLPDNAPSDFWVYIEFSYDDKDVADMDLNNLAIFYFNESSKQWVRAEKTGVDPTRGVIWANVSHLTIFAAMDYSAVSSGAGDNSDSGTNYLIWALAVVPIILVIIIVAIIFMARKPDEGHHPMEDVKQPPKDKDK